MANRLLTSIKRSSEFQKLKEEGQKIRLANWLLLNVAENNLQSVRIGFTIPKKVGTAVVRNRLRRIFREKVRGFLKVGKARSLDINFIFLPARENGFFKRAQQKDFAAVFGRLENLILEEL